MTQQLSLIPETKVVHCKKHSYDIYIGRSADKRSHEHFGNPFSHKTGTQAFIIVESREKAIEAFRKWLTGEDWTTLRPEQRKWILDNLHTLKGKTLGCWCKPQSCHGDVLIELANK